MPKKEKKKESEKYLLPLTCNRHLKTHKTNLHIIKIGKGYQQAIYLCRNVMLIKISEKNVKFHAGGGRKPNDKMQIFIILASIFQSVSPRDRKGHLEKRMQTYIVPVSVVSL